MTVAVGQGRRDREVRAQSGVARAGSQVFACAVSPVSRFAVLLLALGPAGGASAEPPAPTGELLDQVWSGHPVGFALLVEQGHQFVAYYDAQRRITVLGRRIGAPAWARVQPPGVPVPRRGRDSNVTGWDSHNSLHLALDRDGHLHLSGNLHVDPLVYYRTRVPHDVTTLERIDRMTGEREERCTYPVFFRDGSGELLFRYRDGSSGDGSDLYNRYDRRTRAWRRVLETPLLDGEGECNAYATAPILGPDGRFHLVWMWRDTPDCATNHTLSYARSGDFLRWETSAGAPLGLPITRSTGEVIDPAAPGGGLINMSFHLAFDAQSRPLVTYHRYDAAGRSQAFLARRAEAGGWEIRQLSDWDFRWAFSGGGSIEAEVRVGPAQLQADGTLVVGYATREAGAGRWRLHGETLAMLERLPPAASPLPEALRRPVSGLPGAQVHTAIVGAGGERWVLRWETLGRNRDRPRETAPPPTELRLYRLPDGDPAPPP